MASLHEDANKVLRKPYFEVKDFDQKTQTESQYYDLCRSQLKQRDDSAIMNLFYGLGKTIIDCPVCKYGSIKYEHFNMLSVPVSRNERETRMSVYYQSLLDIYYLHKLEIVVPLAMTVGELKDILSQRLEKKARSFHFYLFDMDKHSYTVVEKEERTVAGIDLPEAAVWMLIEDVDVGEGGISRVENLVPIKVFVNDVDIRKSKGILKWVNVVSTLSGEELFRFIFKLLDAGSDDEEDSIGKFENYFEIVEKAKEIVEAAEKQTITETRNSEEPLSTEKVNIEEKSTEKIQEEKTSGDKSPQGTEKVNIEETSAEKIQNEKASIDKSPQGTEKVNKEGTSAEKIKNEKVSEDKSPHGGKALVAKKIVKKPLFKLFQMRDRQMLKEIILGDEAVELEAADTLSIQILPRALKEAKKLSGLLVKTLQVQLIKEEPLNLYDCLKSFSREEHLDEKNQWFCPKCKELRTAKLSLTLEEIPPILIVHLKRFRKGGGSISKIQDLVDCPLTDLDMGPYMSSRLQGQSAPKYNLFAITNHYGDTKGGHYTAFCKLSKGEKWYEFDDSGVEQVKAEQVVSRSAYVLFYRRQTPPKLIIHD